MEIQDLSSSLFVAMSKCRNSRIYPAALLQAGDVIPGAEGARKVRWRLPGTGKSGGARVIYFNLTEEEVVLLVAVYAKADRSSMAPSEIKKAV